MLDILGRSLQLLEWITTQKRVCIKNNKLGTDCREGPPSCRHKHVDEMLARRSLIHDLSGL